MKQAPPVSQSEAAPNKRFTIPHFIVIYDILLILLVFIAASVIPSVRIRFLSGRYFLVHFLLCTLSLLFFRSLWRVYHQIWRYAEASSYLRLCFADTCGGLVYFLLERILFHSGSQYLAFTAVFLLVEAIFTTTLVIRLFYRHFYKCGFPDSFFGSILSSFAKAIATFSGVSFYREKDGNIPSRKMNVAIVGAGRVGATLAREIQENPRSIYSVRCFIETDYAKVGRSVLNIEVINAQKLTADVVEQLQIHEFIFAIPDLTHEEMMSLYHFYHQFDARIEVYDYPLALPLKDGKRQLREIDVQDLLFRKSRNFLTDEVRSHFSGKTVLISGGGGSIGSELCRQIVTMNPKRIVIVDICENGAYDIQQELKNSYPTVDIQIRIVSVCNRVGLERVFAEFHPEIVLHAAAHKHVPLMERDCCEAVRNNVFGTRNMADVSEQFGVQKFIMISTDKAVNPTNVMGATKRMCEMLILSRSRENPFTPHSTGHRTAFSATRFGNVLGSNGSVIPLFKRQLENGGPLTITDKRIIRYFMTIPEASQLVLQSGAMAKNGELYVLDMGEPVRILDLAENMIRLSGLEPYRDIDIVEIGLRPGEKLYEELLIHRDTITKTDNQLIFIEHDPPLSRAEIDEKLAVLQKALDTNDDHIVRDALKRVVPTFHEADEVNREAIEQKTLTTIA